MSTGFHIAGVEELQRAIEKAYSGTKAKRLQKTALNAGGDVVVNAMKRNFESFKDTGYSQSDIFRTDARTYGDTEEIKVGWNDDHGRWRLAHLNEFGYTKQGKQYTPRGFGAIAKSIEGSKPEYVKVITEKMRSGL